MNSLDLIPYERDVDLLLLEEFHASPAFAEWVLGQVMGCGFQAGAFLSAHHSVDSTLGESDLEIRFAGANGKGWRLLIENKIDAALQPRQAARYRERGQAYMAEEVCGGAATLLIAPAAYLLSGTASLGFDASVTYERIAAWFAERAGADPRSDYRARFLRRAIERAAGSSPAAYDALATAFWRDYRALVDSEFLQLAMAGKRDSMRRASGSWAEFVPVGLPAGCTRIIHDVTSGVAYLMFPHRAQALHELEGLLGPPPATLRGQYMRRGGSGTVTIPTPKLRTRDPLAPQLPEARAGLTSVAALYQWARGRRDA